MCISCYGAEQVLQTLACFRILVVCRSHEVAVMFEDWLNSMNMMFLCCHRRSISIGHHLGPSIHKQWQNCINLLAPGSNFVMPKFIIQGSNLGICSANTPMWMSQYLIKKSTLIPLMVMCRQTMSPCWLRSMSPYGVSMPKWVKLRNSTILLLFNFGNVIYPNI